MPRKKSKSTLDEMRNEVKRLIAKDYSTVEDFCFQRDLSKATVSNFLRGKKDFQVSTLEKIADALNKKLVVRVV